MRNISWPTAFALVFGIVPLVVFGIAVLCTYPAGATGFLAVAAAVVLYERRQTRRTALARRCSADYQRAAALVAAPLPDMPTVPMRKVVR
jgi:membrane protein implicated in regulation of membrane protease activity